MSPHTALLKVLLHAHMSSNFGFEGMYRKCVLLGRFCSRAPYFFNLVMAWLLLLMC